MKVSPKEGYGEVKEWCFDAMKRVDQSDSERLDIRVPRSRANRGQAHNETG